MISILFLEYFEVLWRIYDNYWIDVVEKIGDGGCVFLNSYKEKEEGKFSCWNGRFG